MIKLEKKNELKEMKTNFIMSFIKEFWEFLRIRKNLALPTIILLLFGIVLTQICTLFILFLK